MTPSDPSAALETIRADLRAAADGGLLGVKAGDYLPAALARHAAALLAATEAALGFHVEAVTEDMPEPRFRYCKTCSGHPAWPCPEVAAITRALNGGGSDAR